MSGGSPEREQVRILRRLAVKGARLVPVEGNRYRLEQAGGSSQCHAAGPVDALRARGLITSDADRALILGDTGRALLRRSLAGADDYPAQHQERAIVLIDDDANVSRPVVVNQDESPLSWLRRRRGRDGRPLIDAVEFSAGERLRSDYSRGQIMPRVTANWGAAVADRRRDGGGSIAELTEMAIAARRRVERALTAVGPELGGLLVDFCCFLKGLEEIERERRWPARSAKVVLRLGLATLARHYGLGVVTRGASRSAGTRHWGAVDYRPVID